jgi:hypothetical protein
MAKKKTKFKLTTATALIIAVVVLIIVIGFGTSGQTAKFFVAKGGVFTIKPICGDGTCSSATEDIWNCPQDCYTCTPCNSNLKATTKRQGNIYTAKISGACNGNFVSVTMKNPPWGAIWNLRPQTLEIFKNVYVVNLTAPQPNQGVVCCFAISDNNCNGNENDAGESVPICLSP